jgi:hypothetical protein
MGTLAAVPPGSVFGSWTTLGLPRSRRVGSQGKRMSVVRCRCACGTERDVWTSNLRRGVSTQCHGCKAEAQRSKGMRHTFADVTWESRWNGADAVASLSQSGADVMAVNFMGVIRFRLDNDDDVRAIVHRARSFADMVESAKREYDDS